jgi:hypothetical protein
VSPWSGLDAGLFTPGRLPPPAPGAVSFAGAYLQAVDLYLTLEIVAMLVLYGRALRRGLRGPAVPRSAGGVQFARRLIANVEIGWTANLVQFAAYTWLYWVMRLDPDVNLFSVWVRMFITNVTMVAASGHIASGLEIDGCHGRVWGALVGAGLALGIAYGLAETHGLT